MTFRSDILGPGLVVGRNKDFYKILMRGGPKTISVYCVYIEIGENHFWANLEIGQRVVLYDFEDGDYLVTLVDCKHVNWLHEGF